MFGCVVRAFLVFGFQCAVRGEPVSSCDSAMGAECQERALLQTSAATVRGFLLEDGNDTEIGEEDALREVADSEEDQSKGAALVASNLSTVSCSPSWIDFGGIQKLKFCFNTSWTDSPQYRVGVITWDHGKSTQDIVIGAGHVYILLGEGKYRSCQWKVIDLMKNWLPNNADGKLAQQGAQFKLAQKYFVIGYSRAGSCAANTAIAAGGSVPSFKGVMTMGVFRWVGTKGITSDTVPWLSWSCGYTGDKADYGPTSRDKILKAQQIMGPKFINMHWEDCHHTSYSKHWTEITASMLAHIRNYAHA